MELYCDGIQLSDKPTAFYLTFAPCEGPLNVKIYDTDGSYFSGILRDNDNNGFKSNEHTPFDINYSYKKSIEDDLIDLFKNGGSYKLPMDFTVSDQTRLVASNGKTVNLDLNGYTLTTTHSKENYGSIYAENSSILRITNGTLKYDGAKYLLGAFGLINNSISTSPQAKSILQSFLFSLLE